MEPHRTTVSSGRSRLRLGALAGALLMAAATRDQTDDTRVWTTTHGEGFATAVSSI
ncbi:hypothetical protein [Amycolatopsis keratiniphila]|uniref:hypothetical protein n=1 Tax=Amycolatopsis keratiniphila TaxID=129921 RepID=UPI00039D14D4|nr:hypothetical protein [Amycolatopsis keratiniphila]